MNEPCPTRPPSASLSPYRLAAAALPARLLRRGDDRPGERRLREAAVPAGSSFRRSDVRDGRRGALCRLHPVRNSQQPSASARRRPATLLRIMTLWGLFAMAMAFAADRWGFYGARFMIGAAEAGFFPGMLFLPDAVVPERLAREHHLAVRAGGAAFRRDRRADLKLDHDPSGWRRRRSRAGNGCSFSRARQPWCSPSRPSLYLPNRPSEARFLSDGEKARAQARPFRRRSGSRRARKADLSPRSATRALYVLALVYFGYFSTQSILLLVGPDPVAQRRPRRPHRDRLARFGGVRRRRDRHGRDRLALRPHRRAALALDLLRRPCERGARRAAPRRAFGECDDDAFDGGGVGRSSPISRCSGPSRPRCSDRRRGPAALRSSRRSAPRARR